MRALAERFKALADETRLRILALILLEGELCVCDVVGVLDITQSKASRHLRYLAHAGLLVDRRDGAWVHYGLSPEAGAGSAAGSAAGAAPGAAAGAGTAPGAAAHAIAGAKAALSEAGPETEAGDDLATLVDAVRRLLPEAELEALKARLDAWASRKAAADACRVA